MRCVSVRTIFTFGLTCAVVSAPWTSAGAESVRLPDGVVPLAQSVVLRVDPMQAQYSGSTIIDVQVETSAPAIHFHAEKIEILSVALAD